jgi:hypothetical protein
MQAFSSRRDTLESQAGARPGADTVSHVHSHQLPLPPRDPLTAFTEWHDSMQQAEIDALRSTDASCASNSVSNIVAARSSPAASTDVLLKLPEEPATPSAPCALNQQALCHTDLDFSHMAVGLWMTHEQLPAPSVVAGSLHSHVHVPRVSTPAVTIPHQSTTPVERPGLHCNLVPSSHTLPVSDESRAWKMTLQMCSSGSTEMGAGLASSDCCETQCTLRQQDSVGAASACTASRNFMRNAVDDICALQSAMRSSRYIVLVHLAGTAGNCKALIKSLVRLTEWCATWMLNRTLPLMTIRRCRLV